MQPAMHPTCSHTHTHNTHTHTHACTLAHTNTHTRTGTRTPHARISTHAHTHSHRLTKLTHSYAGHTNRDQCMCKCRWMHKYNSPLARAPQFWATTIQTPVCNPWICLLLDALWQTNFPLATLPPSSCCWITSGWRSSLLGMRVSSPLSCSQKMGPEGEWLDAHACICCWLSSLGDGLDTACSWGFFLGVVAYFLLKAAMA